MAPLPGEEPATAARFSKWFPSTHIQAAFCAACADELAALKPGNVHAFADGHGMTVADFASSADAAAGPLCAPGANLGARILGAVTATRAAVGQNTNLGIVLLCAPLAMAAEPAATADALAGAVRHVLAAATMDDARETFAAIALAAPGGLGDAAAHDVRAPPTASLTVAMAAAADRDSIAAEWTNGFASVFGLGLGTLRAALAAGASRAEAATRTHLAFMADRPDSHILRKHGAAIAEAVRRDAAAHADADQAALLAWDTSLKARNVNPGTSADLTVATLFADRLCDILRARTDDV